jgi:hypothetical protein
VPVQSVTHSQIVMDLTLPALFGEKLCGLAEIFHIHHHPLKQINKP